MDLSKKKSFIETIENKLKSVSSEEYEKLLEYCKRKYEEELKNKQELENQIKSNELFEELMGIGAAEEKSNFDMKSNVDSFVQKAFEKGSELKKSIEDNNNFDIKSNIDGLVQKVSEKGADFKKTFEDTDTEVHSNTNQVSYKIETV